MTTWTPLEVASRFLAAYAAGDAAAIRDMAAPGATAHYVPRGDAGRSTLDAAAGDWSRYPAALADFAMPVIHQHEDAVRHVGIVATLNSGSQRAAIDGRASAGRAFSCPHLFIVACDGSGRIASVEIWCDEATLQRQLVPTSDAAEAQP